MKAEQLLLGKGRLADLHMWCSEELFFQKIMMQTALSRPLVCALNRS